MSDGEDRFFWVHCGECKHSWVAAHLPMEMSKVGRLLSNLMCPKCAAESAEIYCGKAKE